MSSLVRWSASAGVRDPSVGRSQVILPTVATEGGRTTPSVRDKTSYASAVTETSAAVPIPSGAVAGDVHYIFCELTASAGAITTPTGYTAVVPQFDSENSTSAESACFRKDTTLSGGGGSVTITFSSGRFAAASLAVQDVDTSVFEDVAGASDNGPAATTTSVDAPTLTPANANSLLLTGHTGRNPTVSVAVTYLPPSGMTEEVDVSSAVVGSSNASVEVASLAVLDTNPTGTKTATVDSAVSASGMSVLVRGAPGGGQSFTQTITDTVGLLDAASQVLTATQTATEPEGITDQAAQQLTAAQAATDAVGILDAVTYDKGVLLTITDPVGVSDAASQQSAAAQAVTDPVGLVDAAAQATSSVRSSTDPVGLLDAASQVSAASQSTTDPIGITDAAAQAASFAQTRTDPEGLSDAAAQALTATQAATDAVGLLDAAAQAAAAAQAVVDPVGLLDSTSQQTSGSGAQTITDAVGITDAASRAATHQQARADFVGIVDSDAAASLSLTITNPVGAVDAAAQTLAAARVVADAEAITDAAAGALSGPGERAATDPVGITDALVAVVVDVSPRWVESAATGVGLVEGAGAGVGLVEGGGGI